MKGGGKLSPQARYNSFIEYEKPYVPSGLSAAIAFLLNINFRKIPTLRIFITKEAYCFRFSPENSLATTCRSSAAELYLRKK